MSTLKWLRKRLGYALMPVDFPHAAAFGNLSSSPEEGRVVVHLLWIGGVLSRLERLCCSSFVRNGYEVKLWTYGPMSGVPPGVSVCDASEILPESRVFRYANGSFAGFSDLFRYAVLARQGGLWADADMVCLLPASELRARLSNGFLVTERTRSAGRRQITNSLIYCPQPQKGDIVDLALAVTDRYDTEKLLWGDCGPRLLSHLAKAYPRLVPRVMEPNFANPLRGRDFPNAAITPGKSLPRDACFLHCYNNRWRGVDKNAPWPKGSILGDLAAIYLPAM